MTTPRQILVPTDFSEEADAAKVYEAMLAESFGATLHVLHVIVDPLAMGWGVDASFLPQLLERTERAVRDQLDKVVTAADRKQLGARVIVETGSPATKIVEYADKNGIDLIVMGTHGRGALERMWVGSVTQGVLQRASCPVVSLQHPRR